MTSWPISIRLSKSPQPKAYLRQSVLWCLMRAGALPRGDALAGRRGEGWFVALKADRILLITLNFNGVIRPALRWWIPMRRRSDRLRRRRWLRNGGCSHGRADDRARRRCGRRWMMDGGWKGGSLGRTKSSLGRLRRNDRHRGCDDNAAGCWRDEAGAVNERMRGTFWSRRPHAGGAIRIGKGRREEMEVGSLLGIDGDGLSIERLLLTWTLDGRLPRMAWLDNGRNACVVPRPRMVLPAMRA